MKNLEIKNIFNESRFYKKLNDDVISSNFIKSLYETIDTIYTFNNAKVNSLFRSLQLYKTHYEKEIISLLFDNVYLSSDIDSSIDEAGSNTFYNKMLSSILESNTTVISADGYVEAPLLITNNRIEIVGNWNNVFDLDIGSPYTILGYGNGNLKCRMKVKRRVGFNKMFITTLARSTVKLWLTNVYGVPITDKVTNMGFAVFSFDDSNEDVYLNIEDENYFSHVISIFDIGFLSDESNGVNIVFDMNDITFTTPFIIFNKFGGASSSYKLVNKEEISDSFELKDGINILPSNFVKFGRTNLYIGDFFNNSHFNVLQFSNNIKYIPFLWIDDGSSLNTAIYPLEDMIIMSDENMTIDIIGYNENLLNIGTDVNTIELKKATLYKISGASTYQLSSDNYKTFEYNHIYFLGADYTNSIEHNGRMMYLVPDSSNIVLNRDYINLQYFYVDLSDYNMVVTSESLDTYGGFLLGENITGPFFATMLGMLPEKDEPPPNILREYVRKSAGDYSLAPEETHAS